MGFTGYVYPASIKKEGKNYPMDGGRKTESNGAG